MSKYTVYAEEGATIPTFKLNLMRWDDLNLAQVILIPHSLQLYEIHLSHVHWSLKGRMKEVVKEGFKFIFNDMKKVEKIMAMIPTRNRLACKLASQCMNHEGTLTNSYLHNGSMENQEIYGISREEVKCL